MQLKDSIQRLMQKQNLDVIACEHALNVILETTTNPLHTAAFLVLLRAKKETPEELVSLINGLQRKMIPVVTTHRVLDIVGTGGDCRNTVNISTGSALLAASCGIKIAKHGNRAVSSLAGSADVLEALGVNIHLSSVQVSQSINEIGIGFCFAPNFHPAMHVLRTLRKQLSIPTTFNLLGPLLNPTTPAHTLLGVYDVSFMKIFAQTLQTMGTQRSLVAHGFGLDEISCIGPTKCIEISSNSMHEFVIDPQQLGLPLCKISELVGGNAKENAQLLLGVFSSKRTTKHQAIANTFILNAAVSLYLYGTCISLKEGIDCAKSHLEDGSTLKLLNNWIEFSRSFI